MRTAWEVAADLIDSPDDNWEPEPHQIPPAGNWFAWLLMGGRGAGKTAAASHYVHEHVSGPPCLPGVPGGHWIGIIGPTLGDAVTSCVLGPSGLRMHDPGIRVRQTAGGATVHWSNGAEAKIFGAHTPDDIERLRSGGNRCLVWAEELAAWRYIDECWQHMRYGLRVGPWPHVIISTTPKPKKLIKNLVKQATSQDGEVVMTRATTADNPHLDQRVRAMLYEDYAGTRLGRQELFAEVLEEIEGALWTPDIFDAHRVDFESMPEHMSIIGVGVDPAAKSTGNETGIIVSGKVNRWNIPRYQHLGEVSHAFVLGDYSLQGTPERWAKAVIAAYRDWKANIVVAEINNGGDMVKHTLQTYDPTLPVEVVHASRGKAKRAEPVSTVYEQGRVHHLGTLARLEDQMCSWDPYGEEDDEDSPDRMDAAVWILSKFMVRNVEVRTGTARDDRLKDRR